MPTPARTHRDLATAFVRHFAAGDLEALGDLLHPELRFRGPFVRTDTAADYLDSLRRGTMDPAEARILQVCADADAASVFYDYVKESGTVTIAQLFRFRDGRISETVVVFDPREVA